MASVKGPVAHWDAPREHLVEKGYVRGRWRNLGKACGSVTVGVARITLEPGRMPTPPHVHGAEEEIFYVLAGSGLSWQDGETFEVRAGDCIVHEANTRAHTLRAGEDGLEVLAFGQRVAVELCNLPRGEVGFLGPRWVSTAGPGPWDADTANGPPEFPAPSPRPATIVNLADVEARDDVHATVARKVRFLSSAAGSVATGLRYAEVSPGMLNAPPHCHSAEEELIVVLGGSGVVILGDQETPVRRGSLVSRPAGTGVAHAFRAGEDGLELLLYGTRDSRDMTYFPRSGKIAFRGLGVVGRIQQTGYWDDEE